MAFVSLMLLPLLVCPLAVLLAWQGLAPYRRALNRWRREGRDRAFSREIAAALGLALGVALISANLACTAGDDGPASVLQVAGSGQEGALAVM